LGYEIWRTHYLTDRDIVGSPGREEVLRVQRPDDVVDIILIDRNPGVSALYYDPDYFGEFGLGFSINRIRTRNHDLSGYRVAKGKYPLDHFPFILGNQPPLLPFVNDLLYLFFDVVGVLDTSKPPEAHSEPILDSFG